jgi:hypothetical protein
MIDVTKVKKIMKEAENYRRQSKELLDLANSFEKEARELCDHSVIEKDSHYCEGSYLDRATTTTYTNCGVCGKQLDSETETHEWYG